MAYLAQLRAGHAAALLLSTDEASHYHRARGQLQRVVEWLDGVCFERSGQSGRPPGISPGLEGAAFLLLDDDHAAHAARCQRLRPQAAVRGTRVGDGLGSGGSPGDVCPTAGTGSRWPRSSAWTRATSGPTLSVRTRSPRCRKARSWRCGRTAPRCPETRGDTSFPKPSGRSACWCTAGPFLSEDAGVQKIFKDKAKCGRSGAHSARRSRV